MLPEVLPGNRLFQEIYITVSGSRGENGRIDMNALIRVMEIYDLEKHEMRDILDKLPAIEDAVVRNMNRKLKSELKSK